MPDRITQRDLDGLCRRINVVTLGAETPVHYRGADGLHQNPRVYYIDGAYGGVALYRTCDSDASGESHGVSDVLNTGHVPKRQLYFMLRSFLEGFEACREQVS